MATQQQPLDLEPWRDPGPPTTIDHERRRVHLNLAETAPFASARLTLPFTAVGPKTIELRVRPKRRAVQIAEATVKRSVEVSIAAGVLVALSPLMIALALAIKLDSPGPVFYRHDRIGRNGRRFSVWKFRSMRCDISEEEMSAAMEKDACRIGDSPVYKSPSDPRITRVGRFIRRTALDELPQMFNVLTGEMSLVGPRPLVFEEVAELSPVHSAYRNSVPPGVTGLWQVFRSTDTSFDERIDLDLMYVACRSLWLDAYLLAMTPVALLKGDRTF